MVRWEREAGGLEVREDMLVETVERTVRVRLEQGEEERGVLRDITTIAVAAEEAEVPGAEQVVRDSLHRKTQVLLE